MELPNTSKSSPKYPQDRISSSRRPRGALQQPTRTETRAPEHLEELSSSLQGTNFKRANQEESKQIKGKQASKQPSKQASKQTSTRANEQTSTRSIEQTSKQTSKRSAGCPEGLAIIRRWLVSGSHAGRCHYRTLEHETRRYTNVIAQTKPSTHQSV